MKNSTSKEAFYERLKLLAEVNVPKGKESQSRNLGTLIDYKRATDGVTYGIIKEQHHYYIKKGGLKQDPNVSDFAYIGGLGNITNFQYKSLAEAEKQRNMLLHTINEATSLKPNKNGSTKKKKLNEDKAEEEIKASEEMAAGLDAATDAEQEPAPVEEPAAPEGGEEMSAPEGGEELPAEMPAPEGGEEGGEELPAMPEPEGGEEVPAPEGGEGEEMPEPEGGEGEEAPEGEEGGDALAPEDEKSITVTEIEKTLGKLTNKIRKTELEPGQVKGYIKSFLKSFADKVDTLEIDERKSLADLILKVVPDKDVEDLSASVPQDDDESGEAVSMAASEEEPVAEEMCAECGSFGKFAESRGYTQESLMECGDEEMGNLISGYANAHNDGQNDGDFKVVALLVNPEILQSLKGDYGHDEYAEKLTPYVNSVNPEEKEQQLAEAWKDVWGGIKSAGQAVKGAAQQAGKGISQAYHGIGVNPAFQKLANIGTDLGKQINAVNQKAIKAGQNPVNVQDILNVISKQLTTPEAIGKSGQQLTGAAADAWRLGKAGRTTAGTGQIDVNQLRAGQGINKVAEGMVDPGNVEVQPNMLKEDDEPEPEEVEKGEIETGEVEGGEVEDTKNGIGFSSGSQNLGAAIMKPESAPMTTVDVNISPDKSVNIQMSEGEKKLRKYIRERLEVKAGLRKEKLTESKKSPTLKKLDSVIDEQFKLYESVVLKKKVIKESYPDFPEPGHGDGLDPSELRKGEKYTWFMGAQPLECTFVGYNFKPIGFKFDLEGATHILGGKDVRDYIYPIDLYNERQGGEMEEGFGDVVGKGMNAFNQSIEGKFKKQRALRAAIEADPQMAKNALLNAYSAEITFNAGLGKYISSATPENALQIAQQAANDPDGLGKVTVQNGVLVYIPAIKM